MKRTIITMMAGWHSSPPLSHRVLTGWRQKGSPCFQRMTLFILNEFIRHAAGENDIRIEILYAGVCYSDLQVAWYEQQEQELYADASEIDKAWRNVADGKVKFRYVIDMSTIK